MRDREQPVFSFKLVKLMQHFFGGHRGSHRAQGAPQAIGRVSAEHLCELRRYEIGRIRMALRRADGHTLCRQYHA